MMTPRSSHVAAVALLFTTLSWSSVGRAQRASSQAAAQALFEEGRKLMTAGKFGDACPKLAESQRLDPGAGTLLNLAACYERNGQTASAWATYKEAVSESEKSNRPEWAAKARKSAAALEPSLAKLVVVVPSANRAAGLTVKRDGAEVGAGEWGVPIPVDPGTHQVQASAPGRKPWTTTIQVGKSRESVPVTVPALEPEPAQTASSSPAPKNDVPPPSNSNSIGNAAAAEDPSRGNGQRMIGLVLGGVGIVGLGVGAVFGLQAVGARNDAKGDCSTDFTTCNQRGIDAIDDSKSKATISTIGFAAGGALLAGGAVLFLTAPRHRESAASRTSPWRVGFAPQGLGVGVSGGFR